MKIHHLGIVVSDVDEALEALGIGREEIVETVYDPIQKNNLHIIPLKGNNLWIELIEPTAPDSSTYNFAKKFSLGLHHLSLESGNLEKAESSHSMRSGNFPIGRYSISMQSFGGAVRTLFVAVKGLILEYIKVEDK
ncbi:MAG: hypothetical protein E4H32_07140 [Nitrospirales bacterium]|nr:MAG: hypothetical protein E4H32_07140 [Nitrospirales bacterium]